MSRTTYGPGAALLERQPESELVYHPDGLIDGQIAYEFDHAGQRASVNALLGSQHPDDSAVYLYALRITKGRLGKSRAVFDCIGLSRSPTTPAVSMDPSVTTEPIETHPDFLSFAGTAGAPVNGARFDDETGEFLGFFGPAGLSGEEATRAAELMGVSSYYTGSPVLRASYYSFTPPTFGASFRIARPHVPTPSIGGVQNWLRMAPKWDTVSGTPIYRVSEEWMGSSRDRGWSTLVY
jgi:hypothetical protein